MKNQHNVYYSLDSQITKDFFATVQNKMHFAVHGNTVAEVIAARADHTKEHMGLTSWRNAPDGKIVKADVSIAKNYLFGIGMAVHLICSLIFYRYEQKLEPARSN